MSDRRRLLERVADAEASKLPVLNPERVLATPIDWNKWVRAGGGTTFLTASDVDAIKPYVGKRTPEVTETLERRQDGREYVPALLKALKNINEREVAQCVLTMLNELLNERAEERVQYFLDEEGRLAASAVMNLLSAPDPDHYVQHMASSVLSRLFREHPQRSALLDTFLQWVISRLEQGTQRGAQYPADAVHACMRLMRSLELRDSLAKLRVVRALTSLIQPMGKMPQALYEIGFCLWAMSYCDQAMEDFLSSQTAFALVNLAKSATKEKLVRVIVSTFRNLSPKRNGVFVEIMVDHGLPRVLESLATRTWADQDVKNDIETLLRALQDSVHNMTTMDRYEAQVASRKLEWGPLHKEKFFREHAERFENNNFDLIKRLTELLSSDDPTTVAVACHDLGEFVRYYPGGRSASMLYGAKVRVMELVKSSDKDVKHQALLACSKMMLRNWEYLEVAQEEGAIGTPAANE